MQWKYQFYMRTCMSNVLKKCFRKEVLTEFSGNIIEDIVYVIHLLLISLQQCWNSNSYHEDNLNLFISQKNIQKNKIYRQEKYNQLSKEPVLKFIL